MRALVTHPDLAAPALADTLPPIVAVPVPTLTDVIVENYGQTQVKVDDGSDGKDVIVAGKHWTTRLDASKLPATSVPSGPHWSARCRKAGWQLSLSWRDWNPKGASRDHPSSRVSAVTTQACAASVSQFGPADPACFASCGSGVAAETAASAGRAAPENGFQVQLHPYGN